MVLPKRLPSDFANKVDELIHADEFIRAKVEWFCRTEIHEAHEAFDAIVHIAEAARLLPVTPYVDCRSRLGLSNLAADRSGSFLPSAFVRPEGSVDIVQA